MPRLARLLLGLLAMAVAIPCFAEKKYGPGVTDSAITIGQTFPMSGPAQPLGVPGLTQAGFIRMINERGGINGRRINLIQLDNGYVPAKALEAVRELVEKHHVLAVMGNLGTVINVALLHYFRDNDVPNLLAISGAAAVNDPVHFPQTVPLLVQYRTEGKVYAQYLRGTNPNARVAILYQDDLLGRDYRTGFRAGLGDRASRTIVAEASYQLSDPAVDSQIIALQASGADALVLFTTVKFGAQALRKAGALGWKPLRIVNLNTATGLKSLGAPITAGVISSSFEKDPLDPAWADDPDMKRYRAFMREYVPGVDPDDGGGPLGYGVAFVMVEVLKRCGDELTRAHLLDVVTHLHGLQTPVGLPGTTVDYSPTDYDAQKQFRILQYDGARFVPLGKLVKG